MGACCGSSTNAVRDPSDAPRRESDFAMAKRLQAKEDARQGQPSSAPYPTMLGSEGRRRQDFDAAGGKRHEGRQGQDWGAAGGKRLGGDSGNSGRFIEAGAHGADAVPSVASMRRRAAEAAERRQVNAPGISQAKASELRERQQKEELLGKLTEHYARQRLDMPIGLKAASVEQLKKHLDSLHKEVQ